MNYATSETILRQGNSIPDESKEKRCESPKKKEQHTSHCGSGGPQGRRRQRGARSRCARQPGIASPCGSSHPSRNWSRAPAPAAPAAPPPLEDSPPTTRSGDRTDKDSPSLFRSNQKRKKQKIATKRKDYHKFRHERTLNSRNSEQERSDLESKRSRSPGSHCA